MTTTVMTTAIIIVGVIVFFNICVLASVEKEREGRPFFVQWNEEVISSQDTRVGRFLMRTFYIIPTGVAGISRCKNR